MMKNKYYHLSTNLYLLFMMFIGIPEKSIFDRQTFLNLLLYSLEVYVLKYQKIKNQIT